MEQLHALARAVYHGQRGRITAREVYDRMNAGSCPTLILACIVYWQAKEISRLAAAPGFPFDPERFTHVSPVAWKNVILYGEIEIDPATLRIGRPWSAFLHECSRYAGFSSRAGTRPHVASLAGPDRAPLTACAQARSHRAHVLRGPAPQDGGTTTAPRARVFPVSGVDFPRRTRTLDAAISVWRHGDCGIGPSA